MWERNVLIALLQVIPESEYTIGTIAQALVTLNLLATYSGPRQFPLETAKGNSSHILVKMSRHLKRSVQLHTSCSSIFENETVARFGSGSTCSWLGSNGSFLFISLGKFSSLTNGTILHSVSPLTGFSNANTEFWRTSTPVLMAEGASHIALGAELGHCSLQLTWEELVALKAGGALVRTGGLGLLSRPPNYLVWACLGSGHTSGDCPRWRAGTGECFQYNEVQRVWEWMGLEGPTVLGFDSGI
jgi:hypothetical protein